MMLISSAFIKRKLTFINLADHMEHLPIVATWAEGEWGYIRKLGVEYRRGVMDSMRDHVYVGMYAGKPVGMFALLPEDEFHADFLRLRGATQALRVRKLMYVYVAEEFRGCGFGRQIIDEAKRLAIEAGANLILLDTLKHGLNRMYEKQGAELLRESDLLSYPTEELVMRIR